MKKLFLFFVSFTFLISCGDINKSIDNSGTTKLMKVISEKENFSQVESLIKTFYKNCRKLLKLCL